MKVIEPSLSPTPGQPPSWGSMACLALGSALLQLHGEGLRESHPPAHFVQPSPQRPAASVVSSVHQLICRPSPTEPHSSHCQDGWPPGAPNPSWPTSSEGEGGLGSGLQTKASFRRSSMPLFITLSSLG